MSIKILALLNSFMFHSFSSHTSWHQIFENMEWNRAHWRFTTFCHITVSKKIFWKNVWNDRATLFAWPHFSQITMVPDNWPAWNSSAQPISHLGGSNHLSSEIFLAPCWATEKMIKIEDFWDWDRAVSCHHEVRAIHPIREWRPAIAVFLFGGDLA